MKLIDVGVEITTECNRTCSYCPRALGEILQPRHMENDVFFRIVDELKKNDFRGRFCYNLFGEPLLSSRLEEFVKHVGTKIPLATSVLFTNGTLLTKERFEILVDAGIRFFVVTKHEGVSQLPLESFFETLTEELKKKVYFQHYTSMTMSNRSGLLRHLDTPNQILPLKFPCRVPLLGAYFSVEGNLLPCYDDYQQRYIVGNIMTEELSSIRSKPEFIAFCSLLKKGERSSHILCQFCSSQQLLPI